MGRCLGRFNGEGKDIDITAKETLGWGKKAIAWLKDRFQVGATSSFKAGLSGTLGSNIASAGAQALNVDVVRGVAAIGIKANLHRCIDAGSCTFIVGAPAISGFMNKVPPNYPGIVEWFEHRGWRYRTYRELLTRSQGH